jgi:hypothetical protein
MKAIVTKYLPFTNHKPSRIKASAEGVSSVIYTCDSLSDESNLDSLPIRAAKRFALANNWPTNLASGQLPSGEWAHCFIPDTQRNALELAEVTIRRLAKTDSANGTLEIISQALNS